MSWLNELQTAEMARWAYQAALSIIEAVVQMLPGAPGALDMLKSTVDSLPKLSPLTSGSNPGVIASPVAIVTHFDER